MVCFPTDTAEVAAAVRACRDHGRPFVPRGSGTGLAGGATPAGEVPPVVIVTTKMNQHPRGRRRAAPGLGAAGGAQPGPVPGRRPLGLHFAPDPSSQQSCSVGGNLANNSGRSPLPPVRRDQRPHPGRRGGPARTATVAMLGGLDPEPDGLDLRGAFVGSEGTMGIATRIAVRLTPLPPTVATLLADFPGHGRGRGGGDRHHCGRDRARRAGDDGRDHRGGGRGLRARRPADRRGGRPAGRGRRAGRAASTCRPSGSATCCSPTARGRCASPRRRPSGPCGGRAASRRSGPSPVSPPTTTSTTAWCRAPGWSRCSSRWAASPPRTA